MAVILGTIIPGLSVAGSATAADLAPHRALYTLSLERSDGGSGVTGASGTMAYELGETCEAWIVGQRYRLKMGYSEASDMTIASSLESSEAKDGLRYRFEHKETRADEEEKTAGTAKLDGKDKAGAVEFDQPSDRKIKLPPLVLFPTAHTAVLIDKAVSGENFVSRQVFDGGTAEAPVLVSVVIGAKVEPAPGAAKKNPLLDRPGWRVRLAFFPPDQKVEKPDYEMSMVLLDNGVSRDMVIDYGDYAIRAKLDDIETLPKPGC
ncbi:MAG: cell envelope integrity EipB family protein [Alphaproteobacteria bacterium]